MTFFASGHIFSIATDEACIDNGRKVSQRLLNPAGKRFVSTGASLNPEFLRSTDA